jgi:transposase InsO family protein
LWLASVRDAFSNKVVGWSTDPRATTALVLTALNHALRSRSVRTGQLIFHSDKGAQGGFDWSSQHPDLEGVRRGHGGLEFEDQRCSRGGASAVAC